MTEANTKGRIGFISFLQFVGAVSVIFGHSMNSLPVPSLLTEIKAWVYTYHMPLFFFVSAYLFSRKGAYQRGYGRVLGKRFRRLIVPYLLWNILFIVPKVLFKNYIYDEVQFSAVYFIRIFLRPRDNILGHTWFLCCLFEMFVLAVVLDWAKDRRELWFPVSLALAVINCFGVTNRWLAVGDLMKNGIFFWCGLLLGAFAPEKLDGFLRGRRTVVAAAALTAGLTIVWVFLPDMTVNTLALGFAVLLLLTAVQITTGLKGGWIEFVSRNAFPIYILHWPVIMALRFVFYQKLGLPPLPAAGINFVLGLAIPCGISYLLRKITSPRAKTALALVFGL